MKVKEKLIKVSRKEKHIICLGQMHYAFGPDASSV